MRFLTPLFVLLASPAFADAFERPTPQAQTDTAEFWYLVASLAFVASLVLVQWLVARRQ
jgi:hypothetical protein